MSNFNSSMSRRGFLTGSTALLATPALSQTTSLNGAETVEVERDLSEVVRRNISSFRSLSWEPYFDNLKNGACLVDTTSRALHYWSEDQSIYKLYPTSVPLTEDLTRLGRTAIVQKVEGRERNPEWPEFVGPGPDNPLGTHALYLSWTYYRIHGTHDTRKIGRRSSNGCIGLYNEHIAELFELTKVGTQVLLI
jgi:L,D-transpeptidase ErfK/SrfK